MAVILKESLTFDDVLLVPGHSAVHPKDTSVVSSLTATIQLQNSASHRRDGYRDGVGDGHRHRETGGFGRDPQEPVH